MTTTTTEVLLTNIVVTYEEDRWKAIMPQHRSRVESVKEWCWNAFGDGGDALVSYDFGRDWVELEIIFHRRENLDFFLLRWARTMDDVYFSNGDHYHLTAI